MEKNNCTCNKFEVDEIPCIHAWRVLNKNDMLPDEYCSDFYKPEAILKTCEVRVYPRPDKSEWNIPEHIIDCIPWNDSHQPIPIYIITYVAFNI